MNLDVQSFLAASAKHRAMGHQFYWVSTQCLKSSDNLSSRQRSFIIEFVFLFYAQEVNRKNS